jgi:RNA polymerase sigma-54 factor
LPGASTETGGNAVQHGSSRADQAVCHLESLAKPLSDNQISQMLKEQGIECARRNRQHRE